MTTHQILIALLLTFFAGASTAIGALLSFFTKKTDTRVLSGSMGLSAGVMIYVSFMELLPSTIEDFSVKSGDLLAHVWMLCSFFGGIALIALIDWLVPEDENPHEAHTLKELENENHHHLKRTGLMLALAIGIHNFPEGIATFVTALDGMEMALPIVIAIAIHNIPEGIAVSVPIYQSTGKKSTAFLWSALSGFAEPVGAVIGLLVLMPIWTPLVNAICLGAVAGIMCYISFDELLPGSEKYGHHHIALGGVILGFLLMGLTLLFV